MAFSSRGLFFPLLFLLTLVEVGCVTTPDYEPPDSGVKNARRGRARRIVPAQNDNLESQLGLTRSPADLGYAEKSFNPCNYGPSETCDFKFFTVVHFQLLCRDTEGTISTVPRALSPINHPNILWTLAGLSGGLPTDRNGYGALKVITPATTRGKRLVLKKGHNFVGVEVNEVSKIVLPKNWCDPS